MNIELIKKLDIKKYTLYGTISCPERQVSVTDRKILEFLYHRCKRGGWYKNQDFNFIREIRENGQDVLQSEFNMYLAINTLSAGRYDLYSLINTENLDPIDLWFSAMKGENLKCIKATWELIKKDLHSQPDWTEILSRKGVKLLCEYTSKNNTLGMKRVSEFCIINQDELDTLSNRLNTATAASIRHSTVNSVKHLEKTITGIGYVISNEWYTNLFDSAYNCENTNVLKYTLSKFTRTQQFDILRKPRIFWYEGWRVILHELGTLSASEKLQLHDYLSDLELIQVYRKQQCIEMLQVYNLLCTVFETFSESTVHMLIKIINKTISQENWTFSLKLKNLHSFLARHEVHTECQVFTQAHEAWERICNTLECSSGSKYGVMPMVVDML